MGCNMWNYGADVYYHGFKQEPLTTENEGTEVTDPTVDNIARTSKVTRSGRVFSPEISPKLSPHHFMLPLPS